MNLDQTAAIVGSLWGTAVGDALGLPWEGLSPRSQRQRIPQVQGHHLILGRGMMSDDTEQSCLVAQALILSGGESGRFSAALALRLKLWFLGLPAGVGKATALGCFRLWLGFNPDCSGVFSAGNGPAMRSPILGVCYGHNLDQLRDLVRRSTRLTHTDPQAEWGALAVAIAAHLAASQPQATAPQLWQQLQQLLQQALASTAPSATLNQFWQLLDRLPLALSQDLTPRQFAADLGLSRGVSGYINHTLPLALYSWLCYPQDYAQAVTTVIHLGGDTDTTAEIVGGIVGAAVGVEGIPEPWRSGLWEWPRSGSWITRLGHRLGRSLATNSPLAPEPLFWPALIPRNLIFLVIVLAHGFLRLGWWLVHCLPR